MAQIFSPWRTVAETSDISAGEDATCKCLAELCFGPCSTRNCRRTNELASSRKWVEKYFAPIYRSHCQSVQHVKSKSEVWNARKILPGTTSSLNTALTSSSRWRLVLSLSFTYCFTNANSSAAESRAEFALEHHILYREVGESNLQIPGRAV